MGHSKSEKLILNNFIFPPPQFEDKKTRSSSVDDKDVCASQVISECYAEKCRSKGTSKLI